MKTQSEITKKVCRIYEILEEVRDCGNDISLPKKAVELYEIATEPEDKKIADNTRDLWMHQRCGAEH